MFQKRLTEAESDYRHLKESYMNTAQEQGRRIGALEKKDNVSVLQAIKSLGGWVIAAVLALLYGKKIPFFGG